MVLSLCQASDSPSGKWAAIPRGALGRGGDSGLSHQGPPLLFSVPPPHAVTHAQVLVQLFGAVSTPPPSPESQTALRHPARPTFLQVQIGLPATVGPGATGHRSQEGQGPSYTLLSLLRPLGSSCLLPSLALTQRSCGRHSPRWVCPARAAGDRVLCTVPPSSHTTSCLNRPPPHPHCHTGEGTFRRDGRDQGAQPWQASRSPHWRLPPPATICRLARGLREHVGRQGKPVPSRHSLPQRGRG